MMCLSTSWQRQFDALGSDLLGNLGSCHSCGSFCTYVNIFCFVWFFFLMAAAISFNRIKPHCCAPQIPAVISGMRSTFCWPGLEAPLFTCAGLKWPAAYVINLRGFFLEFMPHQSCSRRPTKYLKGGISVADQCIVNARFPGSVRLA